MADVVAWFGGGAGFWGVEFRCFYFEKFEVQGLAERLLTGCTLLFGGS